MFLLLFFFTITIFLVFYSRQFWTLHVSDWEEMYVTEEKHNSSLISIIIFAKLCEQFAPIDMNNIICLLQKN